MIANPDYVVTYTKAAIALHNFLRCTEPEIYSPSGFVDGKMNIIRGSWRQDDEPLGIQPVGMTSSNLSTLVHVSFLFAGTHNLQLRLEIYLIKDYFYFNSAAGEVSWQYHHITRTS